MATQNAIFGAAATGSMGANAPVPANVSAGKRVFVIGCGSGVTAPSGFSDVASFVADVPNLRISQKLATGNDSGTYNSGGGVLATIDAIAFKMNGENPYQWKGAIHGGAARQGSATSTRFDIGDPGQGSMLVWVSAIDGNAVTCTAPSGFSRRTANSAQRLHVFTRVTTSGTLSGLVATFGATTASKTVLMVINPSGIREFQGSEGVLELWQLVNGVEVRQTLWEAGAATDGSQDICIG